MSDDKSDGRTGKSRRTRYPKEYQINTVKMVYEKGYSIDETARLLNCGRESVRRWVNMYDPSRQATTPGPIDLAEENRRLKKELQRVKTENEFLKKAVAYFARETT